MNKDFAPFELAVKLKEKGFDKPCFGWYYPAEVCGFDYKTTIVFNTSEYRGCNYKDMLISHNDDKHIGTPTILQVLKWLREEKKIFVLIDIRTDLTFFYEIWGIEIALHPIGCVPFQKYQSYEQAAIAGIEYVLNNLI